ncbi:5'-methylthioadenosine/S-adenosylhomocysteine nucleosidase family protein [Actinoplanes friuliensis]|uniref:Purine phosphorylase family 1 n=1 Tax=Actinoplanes friuliensis DSM 7358 TaxID=1246995 RepID=U5W2J6_9ACTN|nr:5'-methylthioadenosine/S-adenosylhomocysteine nucleosidase [Actinoplanes friuliensis]AGZ43354.1 purine phosphorylase family 1 [Actinoplanes friuliensis DSM 7358]
MKSRPIVVLTALNLEYQAVREHLTEIEVHRHQAGTRFEVGRLGVGGCRVALGLTGKGNHHSAVLAERAMAEFDPPAVLFVGIAGALWPEMSLGDVVVATQVYAYHGGTSEDDGLKARPRAWEIPHECDQIAHHIARTDTWARGLPEGERTPKVLFGAIAAGEVVLDSAVSAHARWIKQTYNDALAVEMEAAGLAQAAHLNRSLPAVVVRGISDRADGTKNDTDAEDWQPAAAANAALFAIALAEELAQTERHRERTRKDGNRTMSETVRNIAKGSAQVGVQAGTVHGGISMVQQPRSVAPEIPVQLAELREQISKAQAAGEVDRETFVAAEQELDTITELLPAPGEGAGSRLMLALRKLRGLLLDWTDLASKVTAIIAALRGAS